MMFSIIVIACLIAVASAFTPNWQGVYKQQANFKGLIGKKVVVPPPPPPPPAKKGIFASFSSFKKK